jgi:hypothetical protein
MYSTPYPNYQQPLIPWSPPSAEPLNGAQSLTCGQYGTPAWLPPQQPQRRLRHGLRQLLRVHGDFSRRLPRTHLKPQVAIMVSRVTAPDHRRLTWALTQRQLRTTLWVENELRDGLGRITRSSERRRRKRTIPMGSRVGAMGTVGMSQLGMTHYPTRWLASLSDDQISEYSRVWSRALQYSQLARRLRHWRPHYAPRDGVAALTAYLPRVGQSSSDFEGTYPQPPSFFSFLTPLRQRISQCGP